MLRITFSSVLRTTIGLLLVLNVFFTCSTQAGEPWKFIVVGDSRGKDDRREHRSARPVGRTDIQERRRFCAVRPEI